MTAVVLLSALAACALAILFVRTRERVRRGPADGSSLKSVHVQSEAELH